jgi:hypothetical protein
MVLRQLLLIKKQGISMQKKTSRNDYFRYNYREWLDCFKLAEEGQRIATHSCTRNVSMNREKLAKRGSFDF